MKYSLLFIFLLLINFKNDQDIKFKMPDCYHDILEISSKKPSEAMYIADSLYLYSKHETQKMYALLVKSMVLELQDKRGQAIEFALKALKIAKAEANYCFQARTYTFLSRQYRKIGFVDKGKDLIAESISVSSKIIDKSHSIEYVTMSNLEMVEYDIEAGNYSRAIGFLKSAIFILDKQKESPVKYFDLANCEEKLARSFKKMNNNQLAFFHYTKAHTFLLKSNIEESLWAINVYNGLTEIYMDRNELDSAKVYLEKGLYIDEKYNNNAVKENLYKTAASFYKMDNDVDKYNHYESKYRSAMSKNKGNLRLMINNVSNTLDDYSFALPVKTPDSSDSIRLITVMFVIALPSIGFYYNRKKIIKHFRRQFYFKVKKRRAQITCSSSTESKLLKSLEAFEQSNEFLNNEISLPNLVTRLNTNEKYLRQVLKVHKNTDYNAYINKLRIQYIIEKLNTDKNYLNYKISFLAKESGFSSHSKFSTNFKKYSNFSPSDYINSLKKKS
ncbi:helix-turn-helix domain-containing protein [Formosa sediminum]|uniref:Helix-turn-helix domain-containing protein n=1 Tax=Formosa sediminum TaxID=2594004 RepID=A0A516GP35_9FLAO|nr:helix-turn-helix domain-containing protein [Formosa sediminum]QDO93275.1 helix-turn-helix domain-containing protein [Formosa sediminum]